MKYVTCSSLAFTLLTVPALSSAIDDSGNYAMKDQNDFSITFSWFNRDKPDLDTLPTYPDSPTTLSSDGYIPVTIEDA
ncbi:MAG: hypothetical protein ACR2PX_02630 [Endozoicomonas sp.]|uniref:hypothetical protein n=1 Tax=Endozoicomonas sp. TaxID=1892382 RepID=UPI003D9ACA1B